MKTVYLFGDSIGLGCWDMEKGGWAALFQQKLRDKERALGLPHYYFYNLSIPGNTSSHVVSRFKAEYESRLRNDDSGRTVIFALGANDATYVVGSKDYKVSLSDFTENMKNLFQSAKSICDRVVVFSITPVNDMLGKTYQGDIKVYGNEFVESYNTALAEVAGAENVELIDVAKPLKDGGDDMLYRDGLHLSTQGHQAYVDALSGFLDSL